MVADFDKMLTKPLKGENKYIHGKLEIWNNALKQIAMIKMLYKQSKDCHCQVYIKECKKSDAESQKCSMLSNSDKDDGYFEV